MNERSPGRHVAGKSGRHIASISGSVQVTSHTYGLVIQTLDGGNEQIMQFSSVQGH